MARLIHSPTGDGPNGPFERLVVEYLVDRLPNDYVVLPNFSIKEPQRLALEFDVVVLAPHGVYVLEAKEWYGRISGDDTEWLINQTPKKCPLWLVELKCKVLKTRIGAIGGQLWVEPVLVVPDATRNALSGNWAANVQSLTPLVAFLQNKATVRHASQLTPMHNSIVTALQGVWGERRRDAHRRFGGYEIVETIAVNDDEAEYLAKRALVEDPCIYRIRTWYVSPYLNSTDREQRLTIIRRPTEALARIGRHPNLLQILDFNEVSDDSLFYEVTEWSDYGTLYGFLRNADNDRLTLRERLEIAYGVATALEIVHQRGLVHRNVCPETIVVASDRQPRLMDFDRAFIESRETVFALTHARRRNIAYVPPELEDESSYQVTPASDLYSFGVLLYELLTERVPFESPALARAAGGRLPVVPSQVREGVSPDLDDLLRGLLVPNDPAARPTAPQVVKILEAALGGSTSRRSDSTSTTREPSSATFAVGDIIDGMFRIDEILGRGAFSRVYKVYHLDHAETYAMKLLANDDQAEVLLREYNQIGKNLPAHPNIARMVWMSRLAPPAHTPYILSDYIAGETLEHYCDGRKTLPWTDIRRIGSELLDALSALHPDTTTLEQLREKLRSGTITSEQFEQFQKAQRDVAEGILHRDIKPANILLELPSHRAKLIDFNISSKLIDARGRGGTPRYWAPDRGQPDWRADMDLFSLGVVLYELVMHRHPFKDDCPDSGTPYDPRDISTDGLISPQLAAFLLKSVQPNGADRYQTATQMRVALEAIPSMYAPSLPPAETPSPFPGLHLRPDEVGRPNYNPYVDRLLTLYSQARVSNSGTRVNNSETRGLDDIAAFTYVQTRLDDQLAPKIVDGSFRLVIVTGNAGDGKTAFIQQVERYFTTLGVAVSPLPSGNGSFWSHGGLTYRTNYDGSQDEGDQENDAVLADFFTAFSGDVLPLTQIRDVRLIAVNEGRLLDFLEHGQQRNRFGGLRSFVLHALDGSAPTVDGVVLIDLNLRAVTADGRESLLEKQLYSMLKSEIWAPCELCTHRQQCPIKHNADSLRDSASGQAVRDRVRHLFEIVHLRRRMHITMRDLRSALSWLLFRDHSCDDVEQLLTRNDANVSSAIASLYYPSAFANDHGRPHKTVDDRLVSLLREADVGFVNAPHLDCSLDFDPTTAVPWMTFERRSEYAWNVMLNTSRSVPRSTEEASLPQMLRDRRHHLAQWRRWAFFERRDDGWKQMIPYRSLRFLEAVMMPSTFDTVEDARKQLLARVLDAVSLSEGMHNPRVRQQFLALRTSRIKGSMSRTYRLFPIELFDIELPTSGSVGSFMEFAPDTTDLVASKELGTARLRISLDLLEMLELIRSGYRPSPSDLQGLFVNLLIFRNELLNLPFDRVMVTADDDELYEISASGTSDGIRLRVERFSGAANNPVEAAL